MEMYYARSGIGTFSLWKSKPIPRFSGDLLMFMRNEEETLCYIYNLEVLLPILPNLQPGQSVKLTTRQTAENKIEITVERDLTL